jgi:hypothetical protein
VRQGHVEKKWEIALKKATCKIKNVNLRKKLFFILNVAV